MNGSVNTGMVMLITFFFLTEAKKKMYFILVLSIRMWAES